MLTTRRKYLVVPCINDLFTDILSITLKKINGAHDRLLISLNVHYGKGPFIKDVNQGRGVGGQKIRKIDDVYYEWPPKDQGA